MIRSIESSVLAANYTAGADLSTPQSYKTDLPEFQVSPSAKEFDDILLRRTRRVLQNREHTIRAMDPATITINELKELSAIDREKDAINIQLARKELNVLTPEATGQTQREASAAQSLQIQEVVANSEAANTHSTPAVSPQRTIKDIPAESKAKFLASFARDKEAQKEPNAKKFAFGRVSAAAILLFGGYMTVKSTSLPDETANQPSPIHTLLSVPGIQDHSSKAYAVEALRSPSLVAAEPIDIPSQDDQPVPSHVAASSLAAQIAKRESVHMGPINIYELGSGMISGKEEAQGHRISDNLAAQITGGNS